MTKAFYTLFFAMIFGATYAQTNPNPQNEAKQLIAQKQYKSAVVQLEKALKTHPKNEQLYLLLGQAYYGRMRQAKDFMAKGQLSQKMKEAYEKAVEVAPNSVNARYSLAMFYAKSPAIAGGSIAKAKEQAEAVEKLDKHQGKMLQGLVHTVAKEYDQAIESYKACVGLTKKPAEVHYKIGMLHQVQKQYEAAFQAFARTIKHDPKYMAAYYQYGRTAVYAKTNTSQGIAHLKTYVAKVTQAKRGLPAPTYAYWRMGALYELEKQADLAQKAYEKALQLMPKNKDAQKALEALKAK